MLDGESIGRLRCGAVARGLGGLVRHLVADPAYVPGVVERRVARPERVPRFRGRGDALAAGSGAREQRNPERVRRRGFEADEELRRELDVAAAGEHRALVGQRLRIELQDESWRVY